MRADPDRGADQVEDEQDEAGLGHRLTRAAAQPNPASGEIPSTGSCSASSAR